MRSKLAPNHGWGSTSGGNPRGQTTSKSYQLIWLGTKRPPACFLIFIIGFAQNVLCNLRFPRQDTACLSLYRFHSVRSPCAHDHSYRSVFRPVCRRHGRPARHWWRCGVSSGAGLFTALRSASCSRNFSFYSVATHRLRRATRILEKWPSRSARGHLLRRWLFVGRLHWRTYRGPHAL